MSPPAAPSLSRRSLLAGAVASTAALVVGCNQQEAPADAPRRQPVTITSMVTRSSFAIAHRGGGGDWPEMTAYAYSQAAALPGIQALEISVCLSLDKVLVCSHDPTTKRVTGIDHVIAQQTWSTLSQLQVTAAYPSDPSPPTRPLARFEEVAEAYADRFVLFVEPKVPPAAGPLLTALAGLGQPDRVVWKQYVNSPLFGAAKDQGFGTWGYVLDQPSHLGDNLERFADSDDIDMLGAPKDQSAEIVEQIVAAAVRRGKPTVMWPIATPADRNRAARLGCAGLMTSHPKAVLDAG